MNGRSKQLWLVVGLAVALGLGPGASAWAQRDPGNRIVTTHSQIPVDVVIIGPNDSPIQFTGSFELAAQVTIIGPNERPHVEGFFSAAGVRGVSETGGIIINWKPAGLYRFFEDGSVFPVEATFPLLRAGPGGRMQRVGSLEVSFEVMVGLDGGATGSVIAFVVDF